MPRFINSPLWYPGGKYRVLPHIWEMIPKSSKVISPFFGGGAIELNLSYHCNTHIDAYDNDPFLISFWQVFQKHQESVSECVKEIARTNTFEEIKQKYIEYRTNPPCETIEHAALYYIGNRASYRATGTHICNKKSYESLADKQSNILPIDTLSINFTCADFTDSLENNKTLAICDPPYLSAEILYSKQSNKAGYAPFNHHALNEILKQRECWMLFYNHNPNIPYVKLAYTGYKYILINQRSNFAINSFFLNVLIVSNDIAEQLSHRKIALETF